MKQPLYRDLGRLVDNGSDFAYFCRFSGIERESGEEILFETEEKPILFNSDAELALNEKIPELLGSSEADHDEVLPVFLSYHFIREVFRMRLRNESSWPMIGTLIPSRIRKGRILRDTIYRGVSANRGARITDSDRDRLEANIAEVVDRIRSGELLQTVLSHRFDVEEFDTTELLENMIRNDRSRYVYHFRFGGIEIIGSSPESVFVRDGNSITIHPIAGTRKRTGRNDSLLISSLKNDSKELCEHRMLVDLARNDLSRISTPGSVRVVGDMVPEKFYSVIHLTSTVEGVLKPGINQYDVVSSVFPAGTVSGAPKRRALEIIDRYEHTDRGAYAGAVGLIGSEKAELALPIRTAFRKDDRAYVQAGAGIVKDSIPEREVDEMIAKANTIMSGGLVCV